MQRRGTEDCVRTVVPHYRLLQGLNVATGSVHTFDYFAKCLTSLQIAPKTTPAGFLQAQRVQRSRRKPRRPRGGIHVWRGIYRITCEDDDNKDEAGYCSCKEPKESSLKYCQAKYYPLSRYLSIAQARHPDEHVATLLVQTKGSRPRCPDQLRGIDPQMCAGNFFHDLPPES